MLNNCLLYIALFIISSTAEAQRSHFLYDEYPIEPSVVILDKEINSIGDINSIANWFNINDSIPVERHTSYLLKFDFAPYLELFKDYDTLYLNTINFEKATLYKTVEGSLISQEYNIYYDTGFRSSVINRSFYPLTRDELHLGRYVYFKTYIFLKSARWVSSPYFVNTSDQQIINDITYFNKNLQHKLVAYAFCGLSGGLLILVGAFFVYSRRKVYLYYGGFLVLQTIYYLRLLTWDSPFWEVNFALQTYILTNVVQIAINLSYLLFIRSLLKMEINYPRLNRIIIIIAGFLAVLILADIVVLAINPFFRYQLELINFQRFFMSLFTIYGIIHLLIYRKSNLIYFVVLGTFIFVAGALTTLFTGVIHYMMIGAAIESLIFALGLAYMVKMVNEEKLHLEWETKLVGMSALRAQMNPHFIFNSLNSIQHLITSNEKPGALKYLGKFSQLLRQILENSVNQSVTLKMEIDLLKAYLDLEALRFDNQFSYEIGIDDRLDIFNEEIPLFLVQPFIENAIIHGLAPKKDGYKKLHVHFAEDGDSIKCTITDNGIGREASKEMQKDKIYISRGISVAQKRLEMIMKEPATDSMILYKDSSEGTTVIIDIPKNL